MELEITQTNYYFLSTCVLCEPKNCCYTVQIDSPSTSILLHAQIKFISEY